MTELAAVLREFKDHKIAIYGLSVETERVLAEITPQYQVIGLLDGYSTEGELYGKPVISISQAVEKKVKLILVVARPGSCRAIAMRVGKICMENEIKLIDRYGKDLCNIKKADAYLYPVSSMTKEEILASADEKDIVSFDLFDTLIMRQTLFSSDIFELTAHRLQEQGIVIEDFQRKRLLCEKELARTGAPTLTEIYQCMKRTYGIDTLNPQMAAELEWQTDCNMLIPRQEVCSLLKAVAEHGKKVYIISDSYYTSRQIRIMLDQCGVEGYTDLFVSCEFRTGKTQRLFDEIKEIVGVKSWLHIGDDTIADIESPEKRGVEACHLHSGLELFALSGYMEMWDGIETLSDRIRTGMFVAKIFNSPFLSEEERKICIRNSFDIGYLFFAPIICDFVLWFCGKVTENEIETIFFSARDGYLIKRLYDDLTNDKRTVYFLTSRIAAIRAGIETVDDIEYVEQMHFSGSMQEQLKKRFGVLIDPESDSQIVGNKLSDYARPLLDRAAKCRAGYQKYLRQLQIQEGQIAFFDFAAKGTNQIYIGRLLENHLKGFYFLHIEAESMEKRNLDIEPFYTTAEMKNSKIYDDYYILETILTAPDSSLSEIDMQGAPVYAEETRSDAAIQCVQAVQEGIVTYFKDYQKLCPRCLRSVNKRLDEAMLSLIHRIVILDHDFLRLEVEDSFFNRKTAITDLL